MTSPALHILSNFSHATFQLRTSCTWPLPLPQIADGITHHSPQPPCTIDRDARWLWIPHSVQTNFRIPCLFWFGLYPSSCQTKSNNISDDTIFYVHKTWGTLGNFSMYSLCTWLPLSPAVGWDHALQFFSHMRSGRIPHIEDGTVRDDVYFVESKFTTNIYASVYREKNGMQ